jgi:polyribonucleotide nucleotidyltransferase
MVEIAPKQEGLVHISELAPYRVGSVTDIVDVGDKVPVIIKNIDELGRINLSIKDVAELKPKVREPGWSPKEDLPRRQAGGPRREHGGKRFRR